VPNEADYFSSLPDTFKETLTEGCADLAKRAFGLLGCPSQTDTWQHVFSTLKRTYVPESGVDASGIGVAKKLVFA